MVTSCKTDRKQDRQSGTVVKNMQYQLYTIMYIYLATLDESNIDDWCKLQVLEEQESTESKYVILELENLFPCNDHNTIHCRYEKRA